MRNIDRKKACDRAYYRSHRVKIKARSRRWSRENADRKKAYDRAYHISHRARINARSRRWRRENPERFKRSVKAWYRKNGRRRRLTKGLDEYLRWKYGLTLVQYRKLEHLQNYQCAICKRPPKSKRLAVDHDHVSGRVRGLLCWLCNRHLVGRHRAGTLLRAAGAYLDSDFDGRRI